MEDYYEYLDSNGVTTLYKLIKDDTVALIDSYSVTINGITTNLDNHVNNTDIHTPISDIEGMIDTKVSDLVNSAPETLDTLKELSDALGNDPNFATTVAKQIGTKASKDDVYTKEETDTLLEGKANSVHNHVVSDITDFPTIPTKLSQLENDMGFGSGSGGVITSISWTNITDKPNFATVATSGSYTDLSNTPTIPTKVSQLENDTGFINALTDVVDTKSNQTINGIKTFTNQLYLGAGGGSYGLISAKDNNSILRLFGGTSPSTGANLDLYGEGLNDGGFSLRARTSDKIVGLDGKVDGTLKWNGKNVALDENLVHKTGREVISGDKVFQNAIYRQADITTSTVEEIYRFTDTNATSCGSIYNRMHWYNNNVYNRHQAYNATSGKDMYFEVLSHTDGSGVVNTGGSVTNNKNLTTVTKATDVTYVATMGWVNNPATSTNVVHRSGDETISGIKRFNNLLLAHDNVAAKNNQMDIATTPTSNLYAHYVIFDKNNTTLAYTQYGQQTSGIDFIGLFVKNKSANLIGVELTTNKEFIPLHNITYSLGASNNKWANVYANRINCDNIVKTNETSYIYMTAGPAWNSGASVFLNGKSGDGNGTGAGSFTLYARNASAERYLLGRPDGILNWTGCIESYEFRATTGNAFMAQHSGYTFLIRNDGSNTYLLMSDKDGTPGTWSTARPLIINNATGVCSINGNANTATYATTQATTDNSTKIATTAWVRNYVNSVGGSGNSTLGSSISAYWSTSSVVTNTKQASNERNYPECYSNYIDKTPGVGIIYSGAQLYSELNAHANATRELGGSVQNRTYITKVTAQATFSNPISSTGKYLCTTANTVSFRAYAPEGKSAASVINYSATKSIFIRVE